MAKRPAKDDLATGVKDGPYATVLETMQKRWEYATDQWADIREEGTTDIRFCAGDPWDNEDRQLREQAGRPVIAFDEFGQYVNQLINEVRQHKRAIQVTPTGLGADDKQAQYRQNRIRQIEYRSNAQQAYTAMFENTVQRSYGFGRITAKYLTNPTDSGGNGSSFNQELLIEELPNPDLVTVDPDILKPDGSDMSYAWIAESWALEDYRRRWPSARVQDFSTSLAKSAPNWTYTSNRIQIAEYWVKETTQKKLLLFGTADGSIAYEVFEADLKKPAYAAFADAEPNRERMVDAPTVKQYLTNGFEMLEKPTEWPAPSIPIVCCFGKTLYVDDGSGPKRVILSLVRLARDPAMLLSYYVSCEAELIGMTPKIPYFIRRGSLKPDELLLLQKSLHEPVAVIQVEGASDSMPPGTPPEMPQRNTYEPAIQAIEIGKEGARRAIQAAMGISGLPTSAQRRNEKSGKALQEIRNAEQQGSFHFIDAYEMAITRTGALLNELLPYYDDTARDVTIRKPDDETSLVRINDPNPQAFPEGQTEPVMVTAEGEFDVTLSTGPSFDSERDAANEFADTLIASPVMQMVGPEIGKQLLALAIKLKNVGPVGDAMADLISPKNGPEPSVQELQQQLQQAQQIMEMLTKELQAKTQALETDSIKAQQTVQTEQIKASQAIELAKLKGHQDLIRVHLEEESRWDIERMKVAADLLKTRATLEVKQTEAMIDQEIHELDANIALAGERESREDAAEQAQLGRDHERDMTALQTTEQPEA